MACKSNINDGVYECVICIGKVFSLCVCKFFQVQCSVSGLHQVSRYIYIYIYIYKITHLIVFSLKMALHCAQSETCILTFILSFIFSDVSEMFDVPKYPVILYTPNLITLVPCSSRVKK